MTSGTGAEPARGTASAVVSVHGRRVDLIAEDPPPKAPPGPRREVTPTFPDWLLAIQRFPGVWFRYPHPRDLATVGRVNSRDGYEATGRRIDGQNIVWARCTTDRLD